MLPMMSSQRLLGCEGEAQVAWIEPSRLDLPDRRWGFVTDGDGSTMVCPAIPALLVGHRDRRAALCPAGAAWPSGDWPTTGLGWYPARDSGRLQEGVVGVFRPGHAGCPCGRWCGRPTW